MPQGDRRRAFDHVLVIMFENMYRSYVLANPYMRKLAKQGVQLGHYFGVMHPSQTNYIASIAGELCNVTNDERPPLLSQRTIVDLIEESPGRLRWKAYMDSYVPQATPWTPDLVPQDAHPYYVKHNPFSSFARIVRNEARWRRIDTEAGLFADVLNGELPEYAWFTPNMWNDGHWIDGTEKESKPRAPILVDQIARWLEQFFHRLRFPGPRSHLPPRTLVAVTFDESDFEEDYLPEQDSAYDGPNQVYTVLLGNHLEPGFEEEGYNHYSLLRTIEVNFGLEHLGKNDADSNWFQFLWGRRFRWGPPEPSPLPEDTGPLAAAGFSDAFFVAASIPGAVQVHTFAGEPRSWSKPETLPVDGSIGIAMASTFEELLLVACSSEGKLACYRYDIQHGWSAAPSPSVAGTATGVAMTAHSRNTKVMLTVGLTTGEVVSYRWSAGEWPQGVSVAAARTDGHIALATLGASVYLIAKAPDGSALNVVSYNTAPFNVVTVAPNRWGGPQDDTTIDAWSPSAFPVAHFSARPDASGLRQPSARPYPTSGPLAVATLDGVVHLVHPGASNPLLLTETLSVSGSLTPSKAVSYKSTESDTASNGFGTLIEAGWTHQSPIFGGRCEPGGAIAMARAGEELALLVRPRAGAGVDLLRGAYRRESVAARDEE